MESLGPGFIVIAVLVIVAVAAVAFQPADPMEKWLRLTASYGTREQPQTVQYTGQQILFGGERGGLKELHPAISFEATIDDHGLWLVGRGMTGPEVPSTVKIPGTHIRSAGKRGKQCRFDIFAEPPVRIAVAGDFGAELRSKTLPGGE